MSATAPLTEPRKSAVERPAAEPDAPVLEDKTPEWLRMSPAATVFTLSIGFVFLIFANLRLWHTDLWDHVNYGNVILSDGQLPETEPLLTLAAGMRMTNLAWLSQVAMAWLADTAGLPTLQFVYGLLVATPLLLIAWRSSQMSQSVIAGVFAAGYFVGINLPQFLVIRPQLAGLLCFCTVLVWALGKRRMGPAVWVGFPLLFALWANCHGSFTMGLTLLGLAAVGRLMDIGRGAQSLRVAVSDPQLHRLILLIQLCAAAVLLNPWGLEAWTESFRVAGNPNIASMFEWDALTIRTPQGQRVAAGAVFLLLVIRMTPRRIRSFEVLALTLFGGLALWSQRMINWWAPIAAIVTAVHGVAWIRESHQLRRPTVAPRRTGLWTVVNLGLCWILFSFTNFGIQVVKGRTPDSAAMVSVATPVSTVHWLNTEAKIPGGLAFVPAEWAGYVMHSGPETVRSMVNLHVHVIPVEVWSDYLRLLSGPAETEAILAGYGINLVMIDRERQPRLFTRLQESEDWSVDYLDPQCAVLTRRNPI